MEIAKINLYEILDSLIGVEQGSTDQFSLDLGRFGFGQLNFLNLISKLNQINLNDLSSTVGTGLFANGIVKLFQQGIYINITTIIQEEFMNKISTFIENLPLKTDANFNINELSAKGGITTNNGLVFIYNDAIFIKFLVAKYLNIKTIEKLLSYAQHIQQVVGTLVSFLAC